MTHRGNYSHMTCSCNDLNFEDSRLILVDNSPQKVVKADTMQLIHHLTVQIFLASCGRGRVRFSGGLVLVEVWFSGGISNHQEAVCAQELHRLCQKPQGGRDFQFTFHLSQFQKKSARISRPNQTHGNLLDIKSSLKRMSCSNSSLLAGTIRRIRQFESGLGTTNRQLQPEFQ
eukprot:sb/3472081/